MRNLLIIIMSLVTGVLAAQTPVTESYAQGSAKTIVLRFDYPELIKVSTWEKNEVSITGTVSINGGENDDAFELSASPSGTVLLIESRIKNLKQLPHRITVSRGEEKITFRTKEDFEKYSKEHGRNFNQRSEGVDMDITLEIKVPRNLETKVESTYGMVEIKDFYGPLTVDATYGGVDVTVHPKNTGELIAETGYGQIYSNLDMKFTGTSFEDFRTHISVKPGTGPRYTVESRYGNVYLRKSL